jgi:hypothetical protein
VRERPRGAPSTLPHARDESREREEQNESADATEPADPTESSEHADPAEPIESTEPADPIESTEPSHAMQSRERLECRDRRELIRPIVGRGGGWRARDMPRSKRRFTQPVASEMHQPRATMTVA